MGFLDNSGDIILDVVLTDHGRKELSKGDGSFKITKFALGDEEIDYSLFNSSHASGSSYYDLSILQTPILEAFTDNAASMKTKLVTYENLELLFLPVLELNELQGIDRRHATSGSFIVAVDRYTEDDDETGTGKGIGLVEGKPVPGVIFGESLDRGSMIVIDQGLDTSQISTKQTIDPDLRETEYTIQIDNRFGSIIDPQGNQLELSYIDDDDIAYYVVSEEEATAVQSISNLTKANESPVAGPRGSRLKFKIKSSMDLNTSTYLFTTLGGESILDNEAGTGTTVYHIDSMVRITGMNTGYSLDIPVRFVKYKS
jgi:hypothetical protein